MHVQFVICWVLFSLRYTCAYSAILLFFIELHPTCIDHFTSCLQGQVAALK